MALSNAAADQLENLQNLLQNLPDTIPTSAMLYNFLGYTPDLEKLELYGSEEAVLNQALEVAFAPQGRKPGECPFILLEKGGGLVAVVDVLRKYIAKYPDSAILQKWVEDLTKAAIFQFTSISKPVST